MLRNATALVFIEITCWIDDINVEYLCYVWDKILKSCFWWTFNYTLLNNFIMSALKYWIALVFSYVILN